MKKGLCLLMVLLLASSITLVACEPEEQSAVDTGSASETDALETTEFDTTEQDAQSLVSSEGLEFESNGDGTCCVAGVGTCTDMEIVIPDKSPDGDSVTHIGDGAFAGTGLISIEIPDSVTSIGKCTFSGCISLMSITIPNSVSSIGDSAFEGCTGLTSITIPDSVTSIGIFAFCGCTRLTSIMISNSVTSIDDGVFGGCTGLTTITISDSVTNIGSAFAGSGLTSITIPDSVTSIEGEAFSGCAGLISVTVSEGNTVYHSADNCIIETESKTMIAGCKTSIIPGDGSVTHIGDFAFYGCTDLTSMMIPDSVTSIGHCVFEDCTNLTDIFFTGTEQEWASITININNGVLSTATIHYNYVPEE